MFRYKKEGVAIKEYEKILREMIYSRTGKFSGTQVFHLDRRNSGGNTQAVSESHFYTVRDSKGTLIGLVRWITDGYFMYIIEVMVIPQYQGRGIGSKVIKKTIQYGKKMKAIKVFLFAMPGLEAYYNKFGFCNTMSQAMEIR
jgi:N-acetylglutamate synthase-like GNAT family acetyltransferase